MMMTTIRLFSIYYLIIIYSNVQTRHIHLSKTLSKKSIHICEQYLNITDCYYFSCIDSIYQCGRENLLVQVSYAFCEAKLERSFDFLTRSGQLWAKATEICLMQELNYFLNTDLSLTCSEIDRYMLNKYSVCLTQSHSLFSICSIMCNNLEILIDIFDNWTLKNLNLKRLLLETSRLCQEQSQMEYVIDIGQSNIRTILWSLCLDSLKTKFQNFDPNELMIRTYERSGMFADVNQEKK
ncbi:unnamed protein product [Adineta steineri]|uniref:Uncharacterized protein n=1 Tax=Adineta steineri TaxID=433720 RepID=A0A815BJW7_9BILA|nr:unnamed protein product [Adineta steineri]CAF3540375.1 unnamed protein product [Adineta steineri]